jgi:hypothetical protein
MTTELAYLRCKEDSYIGTIRCRHGEEGSRCSQCQMLAFLCVNHYSRELAFIWKDLSKLIFKELKMLYFRDWQAHISLLGTQRWHFIVREPVIHKTMYVAKKHYADTAREMKLQKERGLQDLAKQAEKLRRQAQKQQQRK